jgi:hypothetical protein
MGPILSFDKSFLEMLSPDEVDELDLQFKLFMTPILVSEIQADLKHPSPRQGKLPEDLVRALARKLVSNHGWLQMHFRSLGLGEITRQLQEPVPLDGRVVVDSLAPNVYRTKDGQGTIYDGRQDWEMWNAWANGNFSEADEMFATHWREQAAKIDLVAITSEWETFCNEHLEGVRSIQHVIDRIDVLITKPEWQADFLRMVYHFLEAPPAAQLMSTYLLRTGRLTDVRAWAPFASSVARLGMIFCCCLTLKFITSRPTNVLDLQYLFYAPFGMVFVSHDRLHRDLWPATTTQAEFVWGAELKADLRRYVRARAEATEARARGETPGSYVAVFIPETSVIARLRAKYLKPSSATVSGPTGDFEMLSDDVKKQFREAMEVLDEQDRKRKERSNFNPTKS